MTKTYTEETHKQVELLLCRLQQCIDRVRILRLEFENNIS